jgi:Uma2 family endonuclease
MQTKEKKYITAEEYLEAERLADYKSEFYNGEIFTLAGASLKHNGICTNTAASLNLQLRSKPCNVYQSDLRIKVKNLNFFTYPDIVVICGKPESDETGIQDTFTNPTLIIEILSDSTKNYDRGEKFEFYRNIQELKEYILISQDKVLVEHYTRIAHNEWKIKEFNSLEDKLNLDSIKCTLLLSEIYHKINL